MNEIISTPITIYNTPNNYNRDNTYNQNDNTPDNKKDNTPDIYNRDNTYNQNNNLNSPNNIQNIDNKKDNVILGTVLLAISCSIGFILSMIIFVLFIFYFVDNTWVNKPKVCDLDIVV